MILTLIPQTPSPFEVNINSGTRILERGATCLHTVMRTFCGVALASFIVDSESLDPTRLPPHVPALNINGIVLQSADTKQVIYVDIDWSVNYGPCSAGGAMLS